MRNKEEDEARVPHGTIQGVFVRSKDIREISYRRVRPGVSKRCLQRAGESSCRERCALLVSNVLHSGVLPAHFVR